MSEIEKMYENAGVKTLKDCKHYLRGDGNWCNDTCDIDKGQGTYSDICYLGDNHDKNDIDRLKCPYCEVENFGYPPFTAEKQIELIKWLIKYDELHADFNDNEYGFSTLNYSGKYKKDFEESLASVINNELWLSLTSEEKQQVKGILE